MSSGGAWTIKDFRDKIILPSALLIIGTAITRKEWVSYAAITALVLGAYRTWRNRIVAVLKPTVFQEFPLSKKTVISHNVAIYRFLLPTSRSKLGIPIGKHISIAADIKQSDGSTKQIVRSYTPVSGDHELGYFDLLIKEYPAGNISKFVASMKIGQTIKFRGPSGAFSYTPNMVRELAMIAGGTGITPMLQIIRAIIKGRATGDKTQVNLIFANVNREDILLKEDLDQLAMDDEGFRVFYVLNNPPGNWEGGVGFVTPEMIKEHLPAAAFDVKLLLCGPPPMVTAMKKAAESIGYPKARPVSKLEDMVFAF